MNSDYLRFSKIIYGFVFVLLSSCIAVKPVEVTGIDNFKSLNTLSDPEIRFDLGIKNPNNYGVLVKKMDLILYSGEARLAGIELLNKTKVHGKQTVALPVVLKPSLDAITALLKSEMSNLVRGKVNQQMELRGKLVMKKFLFTKSVNLKESVRF